MKNFAVILVVLALSGILAHRTFADDAQPVIQNVVNHLKEDLAHMSEYGAQQRIVTTKLNEKGQPKRIEEKNLRTVWLNDKPKNQMVNFSCDEIDTKTGKSRRCPDTLRIKYQNTDGKSGRIESEIKKIRWTNLHKNFDFNMLPPEGSYHVISFSPRAGVSPQNRIEKLLSRMAGKVWVDRQFNVVKAEAKLVDTVSFGLGVAAKVHHLAIRYNQQAYESVWLPSSLTVDFKAKVALVHNERQRIEVFWHGPYRKSDAVWANATPVNSKTSTRR